MRDMLGPSSDIVTVYWDAPPSPPEAVKIKRNGRFVVLAWNSPASTPTWIPWRNDVLTEPLDVVDGKLLVRDRPGLGVTFDQDKVRAHLVTP